MIVDYWLSSHGKHGWHGGPRADFVGERESSEIKRKLNGGPQADDGGEQQLSKIGQQLKGNYWLFTHYIFSAVFIKLRKFLIDD